MLNQILDIVQDKNPRHAKKLFEDFSKVSDKDLKVVENFLDRYLGFLDKEQVSLNTGVESYLRVCEETLFEQMQFLKTGKYSCNSFEDAYEKVYSQPTVMKYYMHGLLLSQVLWQHHFSIYKFFTEMLPNYATNVTSYLEVGAGHGLYISEAVKAFSSETSYHVVDISPTSIAMAKTMTTGMNVDFHLEDFFKFQIEKKFDFITIGEVLEHVEDPVKFLKRAHTLLKPEGILFITTPANAPAIDHIFHFTNADHIRKILKEGGFQVDKDIQIFAENEKDSRFKIHQIPLLYASFLKKIV